MESLKSKILEAKREKTQYLADTPEAKKLVKSFAKELSTVKKSNDHETTFKAKLQLEYNNDTDHFNFKLVDENNKPLHCDSCSYLVDVCKHFGLDDLWIVINKSEYKDPQDRSGLTSHRFHAYLLHGLLANDEKEAKKFMRNVKSELNLHGKGVQVCQIKDIPEHTKYTKPYSTYYDRGF